MYDFSIPMALVDYIPVLFFGIAALLLQIIFVGLVIGGCVIAKYQFNYDVVQHLIDLIFPQ